MKHLQSNLLTSCAAVCCAPAHPKVDTAFRRKPLAAVSFRVWKAASLLESTST